MTEKVKSLVYFFDNYEWINLISAIIMFAVSIGLFINHTATNFELIIIVGLIAILKGFLNFNICLSIDLATQNKKNPISFVLGAFFNLSIGVFLILNIATNQMFLLTLTSLWMVIDSLPYILHISKNKLGSTYKYNPFILSYSLVLITAVAHMTKPQTNMFGPVITVAFFLALSSINLILLQKEKHS